MADLVRQRRPDMLSQLPDPQLTPSVWAKKHDWMWGQATEEQRQGALAAERAAIAENQKRQDAYAAQMKIYNAQPKPPAAQAMPAVPPATAPTSGQFIGTPPGYGPPPGQPQAPGTSKYLQQQRKAYFDAIDANPQLKAKVIATLGHEGGGGRQYQAVFESFINRMVYKGVPPTAAGINGEIHSGFFGPINRGEVGGPRAGNIRDYEYAAPRVAAGSNLISMRTDQGTWGSEVHGASPGGLNVAGEGFGDWPVGTPAAAAKARAWREAQQANVAAGGDYVPEARPAATPGATPAATPGAATRDTATGQPYPARGTPAWFKGVVPEERMGVVRWNNFIGGLFFGNPMLGYDLEMKRLGLNEAYTHWGNTRAYNYSDVSPEAAAQYYVNQEGPAYHAAQQASTKAISERGGAGGGVSEPENRTAGAQDEHAARAIVAGAPAAEHATAAAMPAGAVPAGAVPAGAVQTAQAAPQAAQAAQPAATLVGAPGAPSQAPPPMPSQQQQTPRQREDAIADRAFATNMARADWLDTVNRHEEAASLRANTVQQRTQRQEVQARTHGLEIEAQIRGYIPAPNGLGWLDINHPDPQTGRPRFISIPDLMNDYMQQHGNQPGAASTVTPPPTETTGPWTPPPATAAPPPTFNERFTGQPLEADPALRQVTEQKQREATAAAGQQLDPLTHPRLNPTAGSDRAPSLQEMRQQNLDDGSKAWQTKESAMLSAEQTKTRMGFAQKQIEADYNKASMLEDFKRSVAALPKTGPLTQGPGLEAKREWFARYADLAKTIGLEPIAEDKIVLADQAIRASDALASQVMASMGGMSRSPAMMRLRMGGIPSVTQSDSTLSVAMSEQLIQRDRDYSRLLNQWRQNTYGGISTEGFDDWFNDTHPIDMYISRGQVKGNHVTAKQIQMLLENPTENLQTFNNATHSPGLGETLLGIPWQGGRTP
jgi:hypothetical protein